MRIVCSILVAGAAFAAGASGAIAAPMNGSAIKAAADQIGIGESVHCRPFRHWHRWGYSRGCGGGVTIYERGPRFRGRIGVREHEGYGMRRHERSGVTIRSEERSTVRGGTTMRGEGNVRGGREGTSVRGSATIRGGGTAGEASPRGSAGGAPNNAASSGRGGGTQMRSAPTGGGGGGQGRQGGGGGEQKQQ